MVADLSYRYVEQAFRRRADSPAARRRLAIGRPALAAAVAVAFVVVWSGVVPTGGGSDGAVAQAHQARVIVTGRDAAGDPAQSSVAKPPTAPIAQRHHRHRPSDDDGGDHEPNGPEHAVLAIGDSVMRGASTQLVSALGDKAVVDAEEGRQASTYPDLIDSYRERGELPNRVVIQEGNNGPVYWADATALKAALAGVDHVYLVNVEVPRSWEDEVNSELEQIAAAWPQAEVVDWHDAVSPEMTYDGIHVDPDGAEVYASLIAGAVNGG